MNHPTMNSDNTFLQAGLMRRVAALSYDMLLVTAVLMLVTLVIIAMRGGEPIAPNNFLYQFALLATTGAFFTGFWVGGGQTLGMKAWRLKVQRPSGERLSWKVGLIRFAAGILSMLPLGLGLFWLVFDPNGQTWHDRIADTRVVVLPKKRAG
jgi:uncharacterized RDD family membrane protein YckC